MNNVAKIGIFVLAAALPGCKKMPRKEVLCRKFSEVVCNEKKPRKKWLDRCIKETKVESLPDAKLRGAKITIKTPCPVQRYEPPRLNPVTKRMLENAVVRANKLLKRVKDERQKIKLKNAVNISENVMRRQLTEIAAYEAHKNLERVMIEVEAGLEARPSTRPEARPATRPETRPPEARRRRRRRPKGPRKPGMWL